jgi:short-subunit dehydrogenase
MARRPARLARRSGGIEIHRPVVWITGASRGIGMEVAKQFASIGCEVCLSGRTKRDLTSVADAIVKLGGRAHTFPCDISEPQSITKTVNTIRQRVGEIDVLVNNAGITVFKRFQETSLKEFKDILMTNLYGHILSIKAVLPSMTKRKQGWIINIISNAAIKTFEGSAAYTATKAGMLGVGKVLREELRQHNVKVVNVIPGATETEMWSIRDRKKYGKRMMSAKGVAEAVLSIYQMPMDIVVDEIVLRPIKGDID